MKIWVSTKTGEWGPVDETTGGIRIVNLEAVAHKQRSAGMPESFTAETLFKWLVSQPNADVIDFAIKNGHRAS